VDQVIRIQADILDTYPLMVKPGGQFVYATCSVLKSENEDQVSRFLEHRGEEFNLISQQRMAPGAHSDGFFVAVFEKKV
jgi:16S rRNA (cytosine967-C5)-methyltransferase